MNEGWMRRRVTALAGLWVVVLLVVFAWRIGFGLELEWMEGGSLHQALRLQQGLAIYPEPSAEFVPFLYALKAGAVDFIFPQAYTGIDQELADPNMEYDTAISGAFEGFYFQSYEGPFANPDFRAAFSMSIDRDAITRAWGNSASSLRTTA